MLGVHRRHRSWAGRHQHLYRQSLRCGGADDFDVRERAAQASQNGADHIQEIGPIGEGGEVASCYGRDV